MHYYINCSSGGVTRIKVKLHCNNNNTNENDDDVHHHHSSNCSAVHKERTAPGVERIIVSGRSRRRFPAKPRRRHINEASAAMGPLEMGPTNDTVGLNESDEAEEEEEEQHRKAPSSSNKVELFCAHQHFPGHDRFESSLPHSLVPEFIPGLAWPALLLLMSMTNCLHI